jgi:acyl-CoA reductase-like NAD-dependent aldehyde dehydrogenase
MTEIEVRAPYDGQLIRTIATSGAAEVEAALDSAYRLFRDRAGWLAPAARMAILREAARLMQAQTEDLAREAAHEGGKPLVDSRVEVARAIDGVLHCAELLRAEAGHVVPMGINGASAGRIAFTRREPIRVVVAVSAFNHPLNLPYTFRDMQIEKLFVGPMP